MKELFGIILTLIFLIGYYLSIPAVLVITLITVSIWRVWYLQAAERDGRTTKKDVKFYSIVTAILLTCLWIITGFANWNGTAHFFQVISDWTFRTTTR